MKRLAILALFLIPSTAQAGVPPVAVPPATVPPGAVVVYPCWDYMENGISKRTCGSFQGGQVMVNAAEWTQMKNDLQTMRQQLNQIQQGVMDLSDPLAAAKRNGYIK